MFYISPGEAVIKRVGLPRRGFTGSNFAIAIEDLVDVGRVGLDDGEDTYDSISGCSGYEIRIRDYRGASDRNFGHLRGI